MNDERAVVCVVVTVCPVGIDGEHRELCNELNTLAQHVGNVHVVRVGIIAVEIQNAARQHVHHVFRRRLHDYVAYKVARQHAEFRKHFTKVFKFRSVRQFSEQQKINRLFKTEPVLCYAVFYEVLYVVALVAQNSGDLRPLSVFFLPRSDFGNFGEPAQNALAVALPESALHVVLCIKSGVYPVGESALFGELGYHV